MQARRTRTKVFQLGDRKVVAEGLPRSFWTDLHHYAMTASWPRFFAALAIGFLFLNTLFSLLYVLGAAFGDDPVANARPGSFADYFFFSVETLATVGYGDLHPRSLYGHLVATVATFAGVSSVAIVAGATFARFARPRARLLFAQNPVIAPHDGVRMLMVRFANERVNAITEAAAQLWLFRVEQTAEGASFRKFYRLRLTRDDNPIFALTWTLMHPLDEESPLHGWGEEDFARSNANIALIFSGHDESSNQLVRDRRLYSARQVLVDHDYVDLARGDPQALTVLDFTQFDNTRPIGPRPDPL
jgi:inward rectifier potassium channel